MNPGKKKTMRHFFCRDDLWEAFERMAGDFDCSIDYLVNESMRLYAKGKGYAPRAKAPAADPEAPRGRLFESDETDSGSFFTGRSPLPSMPTLGARRSPSAPPSEPHGATHSGVHTLTSSDSSTRRRAPLPRSTPPDGEAPPLYLEFRGQHIPIGKDQFIIGRGSRQSDLTIKDGNVSRRHAAVLCKDGAWYIKDLGSTNGIEYRGVRIDNKRIDEGDVFSICEYELRFTYHPPEAGSSSPG